MKKYLPILLILLLLVLVKNNALSLFESIKNGERTKNLERELNEEERKNKYLKERSLYVETNKFVEQEAREKLGMLRKDEYFIIAPTSTPLDARTITIDDRPNWKKWIDLFF